MALVNIKRKYHSIYQKKDIESYMNLEIIHEFVEFILPTVIVFLSLCNVSTYRLRELCNNILKYPLSIPRIEHVIQEAAARAEKKMVNWDKTAGEKITVIQADASFKGFKHKFFNVLDPKSGYLLICEPIVQESEIYLVKPLKRIVETCHNLKFIITDMCKGYGSTLRKISSNIFHIFCKTHVKRAIFRKAGELRAAFSKIAKKLQKLKDQLGTTIKWLTSNRRHRDHTKNYVQKLQSEKIGIATQAGVAVQANGALINRKQGLPTILKKISTRIGKFQAKFNTLCSQVKRQLKKLQKIQPIFDKTQNSYDLEWGLYMTKCRQKQEIYRLLDASTVGEFQRIYTRLRKKYRDLKTKYGRQIWKILKSKQIRNYREVLLLSKADRFAMNTNEIEGFHSQFRVLLDGLRNVPDTPYIRDRLRLMRYWHNAVGPITGQNAGISPCKRLGIKLNSDHPIQVICEGLKIV
jgi:ElaB/YqjD/DUF883 family membrane-anchored ribosome-binding protein